MAAFDTTRPSVDLHAAGLFNFTQRFFSAAISWNDQRVTRKALSQLTARELDDIGLTHADIENVVRRTA